MYRTFNKSMKQTRWTTSKQLWMNLLPYRILTGNCVCVCVCVCAHAHVCACVCMCVCSWQSIWCRQHGGRWRIPHGQVCEQEPGLSCGWTCYRPEVVHFSSMLFSSIVCVRSDFIHVLDVFFLHVYRRRVQYLLDVQLLELPPVYTCL